ncbi:MAG: NAD(P)-dependent oxidoreductase [Flavitalea sp.]
MEYQNKTVLISGASRGIGKAIAIRLAKAGANIVITGKTAEAHPKLEGTIFTAAEEIKQAGGGKCLAIQADVRSEESINDVVEKTIAEFGGIDILVNNASAIGLTPAEQTEAKRLDLMNGINFRGTFLMSKACIPHLRKGSNPQILNLSPPINMDPKWFGKHTAYTISKYSMSMIVLGLSEELRPAGISVNALWPQTTIATAAVQNLLGGDYLIQRSRTPEIVADAAFYILKRKETGKFYIDEDVLKEEGINDFGKYAVNPDQELMKDLFL